MRPYQPLTSRDLAALAGITGFEHILAGDDIPAHYAQDEGTPPAFRRLPEAVVSPANAEEIAAILRLANQRHIPVTPRGGGTGLTGGAVAHHGGIVLDLHRLSRILEINKEGLFIKVEAAVRTCDIQQAAREHGLLYAGDPCSNDNCVIGGNIATNAGGNMAVKYGVTSDQIYELEVVTPQGKIVHLGGRLKKNSTGYNLIRLLAGSEGTLGIITKATLKLQPLAPIIKNYLAVFAGLDSALASITGVLADQSIDPVSLELMDRETMLGLESYLGKRFFQEQTGDIVIIQLEAWDEKEAQQKQERLGKSLLSSGLLDFFETDGAEIWQARRKWSKPNALKNPVSISEDFVVPVDRIRHFVAILEKQIADFHFDFRIAGHVGDGNLHIRIQPGAGLAPHAWEANLPSFQSQIYAKVYELGGRLSGEHGIGLKRKQHLAALADPAELELMQTLKQSFDPNHILNPGKIFDLKEEKTYVYTSGFTSLYPV